MPRELQHTEQTTRSFLPGAQRVIVSLLWSGILGVIAVRPWVIDRPEGVALAERIGLGVGILWCLGRLRGRPRIPAQWAIAFMCLLAALTLASPASLDHQAAWLQKIELVFGITLCVSILLADPTHRRQLQMVLTITGALLSLYAIWQRVVLFPALTDFPWSELVTTGPWRNIPVHTAEFAATVIARRRVFGPFPLPGLLASALVMLLPISVDTLRGWATTPARRLFTSVVWGLQGTALLLTQSLGGLVSVGAATLIVLIRRGRQRRPALQVLGITLVAIGMLLVLRPELSQLSHPRNPVAQRWRYWMSTVDMIRDHPVRGLGAANYASAYPRYRKPLATDTRFAHNALLQVWAEWGLLGLLGMVMLIAGSLQRAARARMEYDIAVWAFWLMALIDIAWCVPQLTVLWWSVLGLAATSESG